MIAFRPMEPRDRDFVVGAFMDSYRTAYTSGIVLMEFWEAAYRPSIEGIIDKARVIVAYTPDDPDPIADLLGFIAFDATSFREPYVYYVYVKANFRRAGYRNGQRVGDGLGRRLFKEAKIDPAHKFNYAASTRKVRELERKIPLSRWVPHLARFPLEAAVRHDHDVESQW
jgi:hypothetical protein